MVNFIVEYLTYLELYIIDIKTNTNFNTYFSNLI